MNFLTKMNFTYVIIFIIIIMASIHLYKLKSTEKFEDIPIYKNQVIGNSVQILIPTMNQVKFGSSGLDTILNDKVSKTDLNDAMPELSIIAYSGSTAPNGWQLCDGTALKYKTGEIISEFEIRFNGMNRLSSIVNTPDLRGRFILGSGEGAGLLTNRVIHTMGGEEAHTLTVNEIPDHHHSLIAYDSGGSYGDGSNEGTIGQGGYRPSNPNLPQGGGPTGDMISKQDIAISPKEMPHNNMPPFYILTYIIKKPSKL